MQVKAILKGNFKALNTQFLKLRKKSQISNICLPLKKQECKLNPKHGEGNKKGRNSINLKIEGQTKLMKSKSRSLKDQ